MNTRYIDTSIFLCASMKYSKHRRTAQSIIYNGLSGSSYLIKLSNPVFDRLQRIYNRRARLYKASFSKITTKKCIGNCPVDFRSVFASESIGDSLDDEQLENMFDRICDTDLNMYPTDKFDEKKAIYFCDRVYNVLSYNKHDLKMLLDILKEKDVRFDNRFIEDERVLTEKLKPINKNKKYKIDIPLLAGYISHGINSGVTFEIITADSNFLSTSRLTKVNNIVKKLYGPDYKNTIVRIENIYGSTQSKMQFLLKSSK